MQNLTQLTNNPSLNPDSSGLRGAMREIKETATRSSSAGCVQLFETQAAHTPEATAVIFGDAQLSYRDLNARANQLARELVRLGVNPDSLVGICLERSPEMVVAVLAT